MRATFSISLSLLLVTLASTASAQGENRMSLGEALRRARAAAPDLAVARLRESVAHAEVGVAGLYPNPTVLAASNTQTAKFSGTVSIPVIVLGQRGAAMDAARADEATVALDTQVAWIDVRQATVHAFVTLWLAEGLVGARRESATIGAALESSVVQRVEVGSAPEIDALRAHAERVRLDADVLDAGAQLDVAASQLGRWLSLPDGTGLRASGAPSLATDSPAPLPSLLARLDSGAPVRREQSDVRASEARAARERALVRPSMAIDLGVDTYDPTLNDVPNYRAQLAIDVPIFNQRGPAIDREKALGDVARARVQVARALASAEVTSAYHVFEAATARQKLLAGSVVPATEAAAKGVEEAYSLGRAQLIAVLDAERALVDARVTALDAQAAAANAWADVEHALGVP